MSVTDWEATLATFEERITAQRAALDEGSLEPVAPFEPPAVAAPLPEHLFAKATELVWRCRALEESLATALADANRKVERLDASGGSPSTPAEPVFFDSRV